MKWRGRKQSSNIEDRRGQSGGGFGGGFSGMPGGSRMRIPGGRAGTGSIGLIVAIVIIGMLLGVNPMELLSGSVPSGPSAGSSTSQPTQNAAEDELADFVGVVVKETEDMWAKVFADNSMSYSEPVVVLYSGQTSSGCGVADAATGPFYCPNDQKIYIDLSFYEQLRRQFGAPGDFAQAYVIAHEIGHHVQNLTGVLPEFNQARARLSAKEQNEWSVRVELQADCYAGVWAAYAGQEDLLENGDIAEALNAAEKIGDDTLQERMQGYAVHATFTHGSAAQRQRWFERGYEEADPGACDTFGVASP
ncbi:MAG: zinc metallopeptidase [Alphaproteobacteria bacterium]|nr:zinc metallopeptidase [Alphaproteobacteria bacterium]